MKVLNWIIVLLGLWEFADMAALFVPDFGKIPDFLWNHILVSLIPPSPVTLTVGQL
jgi:hypothetical protein